MNTAIFTAKVNAEIERSVPSIAYDEIRLEQHKVRRSMIVSFIRNGEVVGTLEADMPYFASGEVLTIAKLDGSIRPTMEFPK